MLKKKIIPVFLASVLTVSGTTGFVTEAFSENVYAAEEVHTERLADFADLLDDGQEEELEAKLDQVSEDYGCDVVVVTEETLDGAVPQDYADDFFDYNDYGMGEDKSGILFLITMSERKRCISGVMRSRMKTVHMKPDAADYMKDGSLHINRSRDIFLYHQVTRTAKPKEESSGGGGSSTHTSSSGETHGGSSGSF